MLRCCKGGALSDAIYKKDIDKPSRLWYNIKAFGVWLSLVECLVRDSITTLGVEFSRRAENPWKHWLFRLSRMSKNHQFLGLTTCLTTYKKTNIFTISRCSEGGIAHRSGRWDRRFESCHFDQKTAENKPFWLVFGCFSIYFSQNRLFSVDHMFALISNL